MGGVSNPQMVGSFIELPTGPHCRQNHTSIPKPSPFVVGSGLMFHKLEEPKLKWLKKEMKDDAE